MFTFSYPVAPSCVSAFWYTLSVTGMVKVGINFRYAVLLVVYCSILLDDRAVVFLQQQQKKQPTTMTTHISKQD
ncbi:hypothetical protein T06_288 [Trichinella sp. T6]|nr:hypothetical protein T06_288 [Trichinella sp. T6]